MTDWTVIHGTPIGQGRPRITTRGGKPRAYDPPRSRAWKDGARECIRARYKGPCFDEGPVRMEIEAVFKRPKAMPKGPRCLRPALPDCDNIAKAVLDASTGRVFADDRQVAVLIVSKFYGATNEEPFVRFRVKAV